LTKLVREHWAGCAGSIEPGDVDPLDRAWIELREETRLTAHELNFVRRGDPLVLTDATYDTQWTIHPFLFEVTSRELCENRIEIDWEHTEFRWIRPAELGEYLTVPALREIVQRLM
jgi:8-oxo-dGTP pyrophosphatase MutT (NUDIX family)